MRYAMRTGVALVGLFNLALGLGFLLDPTGLGVKFFLSPIGLQGIATLRADFTALFVGNAAFALLGAWRCRGDVLAVPITVLGIALATRFVSLALDGASPTAFPPMLVEAVMLVILIGGRRALRSGS